MPLPTSYGPKTILGNQSLASAVGLPSHLFPWWQPPGLGLTSMASGTWGGGGGSAGPRVMQQVRWIITVGKKKKERLHTNKGNPGKKIYR